MHLHHPSLLTVTIAVFAFTWTGVGETSNPELNATELPLDIVNECEQPGLCHSGEEFVSRWVGRTYDGDLFLVRELPCTAERCGAWFVEKSPRGLQTRLAVNGSLRLLASRSAYPDVQTESKVSDIQTAYTRFTWVGDRYLKAETRQIYRIAGVECGNEGDCYQAALKAHKANHTDQALKIWETVHGISWI